MFLSESNSLFCDDGFTGWSVSCDENWISDFHMVDSFFLKGIELERILWERTTCVSEQLSQIRNLGERLTSLAMSGTSSRKLTISRLTSTTWAQSFFATTGRRRDTAVVEVGALTSFCSERYLRNKISERESIESPNGMHSPVLVRVLRSSCRV